MYLIEGDLLVFHLLGGTLPRPPKKEQLVPVEQRRSQLETDVRFSGKHLLEMRNVSMNFTRNHSLGLYLRDPRSRVIQPVTFLQM